MYPSDLRARLRAVLDPEPRPTVPADTRLAAVLLPIVEKPSPHLVFTRRTDHLPRHAGEISFPGGLLEGVDAGPAAAALREAHEELGLEPSRVEVLGALSPVHTFVSSILIVPVVGILAEPPLLTPNDGEIAEVLEYRVADLASAETRVEWPIDEHVYRGFAYEMDGRNTIWGATAHILHEFLGLVGKEVPWLTRN